MAANWRELRKAVLARAKNKCEQCLKPNSVKCLITEKGHWYDKKKERWFNKDGEECALPGIAVHEQKTVLTLVPIDGNKENQELDNQIALCQHCMNMHEAKDRKTKRTEKGGHVEMSTETSTEKTSTKKGTQAKKVSQDAEKKSDRTQSTPKEFYAAQFDAEFKGIQRTNGGKIRVILSVEFSEKTWNVLGRYSGSVGVVSVVSKQAQLEWNKKQTEPTTQQELEAQGKVPKKKTTKKKTSGTGKGASRPKVKQKDQGK